VSRSSDFDSLVPTVPFSRRQFMVSALGAGFALTVQPVAAQTIITTDSVGLTAGEVKIPAAGGAMPAYRAQPASGGNWPVILVVQEIFGVHEYIKDVCRRLAKLGYQAIAPELFARQGDPRQYSNVAELLSKVVSKVPDGQVMSDLDACVAWAGAHAGDVNRLGITGFCWGGRIIWLYAAHNPQLKAGVAWYGRLVGQASELTPEAADRRRRQAERASARALRRNRSGHPDRNRRPDERGARQRRQTGQQGVDNPCL
jgi:carboxymethylenebutenolidase